MSDPRTAKLPWSVRLALTSELTMPADSGESLRYEVTGEIDPDTSHAKMLRLVGDGARVLDVGCASGYLARELVARGCRVTGIEYDPELAARAREHCDEVIEGDLDLMDLKGALGERTFDAVVCGDVLEHLRDPVRVLDQLRHHFTPQGYLVVSVPNVAHGSVRLSLLTGKFEYTELGLLDRTHLRFYTRATLVQMLAQGGFTTVHIDPVIAPLEAGETHPDEEVAIPAPVRRFVDADPDAFCYQFVALAYPTDQLPETGIPALLARLHPRVEESERLALGRDRELGRAREELERAFSDALAARDEVIRRETEIAQLRRRVEDAEFEAEALRGELAAVGENRDACLKTIEEIHASTSWRVAQLLGRLRGGLRG